MLHSNGIVGSQGLPGVTAPIANPAEIRRFLTEAASPHIHLTAITPDASPPHVTARWFGDDIDAATAFSVDESGAGRNVYWTPNEVRSGYQGKPGEEQIVAARWQFTDLDDKKRTLPSWSDVDTWLQPAGFSMIIDSGNGRHVYFKLSEANTDLGASVMINRKMAAMYGGECHSIEHLYRVAGTVNWPDAKKRSQGRVPVVTRILQLDPGRSYSLQTLADHFAQVELPAQADAKFTGVDQPDDRWTLRDRSDEEIVKIMLSDRGSIRTMFGTKATVAELWRGDTEAIARGYGEDRSAADMALMCKIAFYAGKWPSLMLRIFERSELAKREKWQKRESYRHLTVSNAIDFVSDVYNIVRLPGVPSITADGSAFEKHRIVETVDLHVTADQTVAALKDFGAPFFHRGGKMVEPVERDGRVALSTVEQAEMIDYMSRAGDFVRLKLVTVETEDGAKSKQWVDQPIKPPVDAAAVVLSRAKSGAFDTINGTSKIPVIRQDGSVATAPGFDPATGIFVARDVPELPELPANPTRADALAALDLLRSLISESPIADEASRSVAISALMTPVLRTLMDVTPLHAFTAPEAGSGKSFLCNLAGTFAYLSGYVPAISIGDDEAEFEKRLASQLMRGQPVLLFDNVNGTIGGDLICQAVTAPMVSLRPLGRSEMIEVKNNYMILVNGNNLSVVADLVRRTVRCTMDTKVENPWEREFQRNPIQEVLDDPGRYIGAIFTIARAHMIAVDKPRIRPFASFEQWSDAVRSPLVWLGMADPLDTQAALKSDDPARDALAGIVGLWQWNEPKTASEIITALEVGGNADLRAHLIAVASTDGRTINPNKLGTWFRANDGKRANGRMLRRTYDSNGKRWRFSVE